jgi:pyridoxamine 5'-phosphate oxidase family protein
VVPVGWSLDLESQAVEIGGFDFGNSKKFREVSRTGRAALVVDDVQPPWRPSGVEIRGTAEAIARPRPMIRIHPTGVISWGLEAGAERAGSG